MTVAAVKAWLATRATQQSTLMGAVIMLAGLWLWGRGIGLTSWCDLAYFEALGALCIVFNETPQQAAAQIAALIEQLQALTAKPPAPPADR